MSVQTQSFPLFAVLGVLFLALKLTHVIAWSWWLVLLPFYVGLPIAIVLFVIFIVAAALTRPAKAVPPRRW